MEIKTICANPHCDNEVIQPRYGKSKIFCCHLCKAETYNPSQPLDQSGYLTLCNGMEVRNDAMGKEIAGYNFGLDMHHNQAAK